MTDRCCRDKILQLFGLDSLNNRKSKLDQADCLIAFRLLFDVAVLGELVDYRADQKRDQNGRQNSKNLLFQSVQRRCESVIDHDQLSSAANT